MYSLTAIVLIVIQLVLLMTVITMAAPTITSNTLINNKQKVNNNIVNINNNNNQLQYHNLNSQEQNVALTTIATSSSAAATAGSSVGSLLLTSASSSSATSMATSNSLRLRKRHRKRHSNWYAYNNFNENSTILEWSNPCGGVFDPNVKHMKRPTKKEQKRIYNILRNTAINDFNRLNGSHQQDIDISNIEIWWLHNYTYKFLPKLKMNSSIALKRWYRNMQTYVASFAYLRRIQNKWDHSKSQRESNTSAELKELLKSSRNMLCELEAAVNRTHPYKTRRADKQMPLISRAQMNKRLKLRTKQRQDGSPNMLLEADSIDLKFVKFHYFEYLKNMWQILRKFNKRKGQIAVGNKHAQTGMEHAQPLANNTQFNEIEKLPTKSHLSSRSKKRKTSKNKHSEILNKMFNILGVVVTTVLIVCLALYQIYLRFKFVYKNANSLF